MERLAIIDADSWCYAIPSICQTKNEETGEFELNEQASFLKAMLKNKVKEYLNDLKTEYYSLHLTKGLGFRGDVCNTYKAQRPPTKPLLYHEAREYLTRKLGAAMHTGLEADDWVGIEYYETLKEGKFQPVMCHIDKDLNQYAGLHYKPYYANKPSLKYKVTEEQGLNFLYRQVIEGDVADNIKGVKGYGPKKAKRYLENSTCEQELYLRCLGLYQDKERLDTNMKLLYLLRSEDDQWRCPV